MTTKNGQRQQQEQRQQQQQIRSTPACGNDRKKGNSNDRKNSVT
jgi:hypothetical protein